MILVSNHIPASGQQPVVDTLVIFLVDAMGYSRATKQQPVKVGLMAYLRVVTMSKLVRVLLLVALPYLRQSTIVATRNFNVYSPNLLMILTAKRLLQRHLQLESQPQVQPGQVQPQVQQLM